MQTASVYGPIPGFSRAREKRKCAADHLAYLNAIERIALGEGGSQQHRESSLVQLQALPIWRAAKPLVLPPAPVAVLSRYEVAQRVAGFMFRAQREQSLGALHQVARPDKVIAGPAVAAVTPRHAQARHHGSRVGLVAMYPQQHGRQNELVGQLIRFIGPQQAALVAAVMPLPPSLDLTFEQIIERLHQAGNGKRGGGLLAAAEA